MFKEQVEEEEEEDDVQSSELHAIFKFPPRQTTEFRLTRLI